MRTRNGGENLTLAGTNYGVTLRVKVANGSGTMIDYSSYVESVSIDHDVDQPVGGATVTFRRDASSTLSLAPLRTDSTLNVDDTAAYAPALDLNRSVTVEVATNGLGTTPGTRTNLALRSQELENAAYTNVGAPVVTADNSIAPDGTVTADMIDDSDAASIRGRRQTIAIANDSLVRTASIFVLQTVGAPTKFPIFNFRLTGGTVVDAYVGLNTETGATVTANGTGGAYLDRGYWRVWITATNNSTGNVNALASIYPAGSGILETTLRVAATGTNVFWGLQVEVGSTPSDYIATTSAAVAVNDYKLMFKGTIDVVNFERSPVSIVCRDLAAPLVDRWIEAEATYGTGVAGSGVGGRDIELVMQDILDDVFGAAVYPLYTPVSPGFDINTYRQSRMSVMDALQDLAQMIGWDIRFKWDDGTSAFRLTLSEPPRTKTVPDYTFAPSTYFDFTSANLDITNIRNVVTGSYRNSANLNNRATVTVSDATSITKYGRRFFYIQEADVSPIDTSAEMTTLITAALADLKDPKTEQEVDMPFFWPADISDLYRYSNNSVHYNTDQDIAVVELTHDLSRNAHRTRVKVRGTPIGQYATWLQRGGTGPTGGSGGPAFAPYPFISPRNTEANDSTWDLRFDSLYGSGGGGTNLAYTVKSKATFGTETTVSSGNASAFPLDLTITRDPKQDKVITLRVTDAATALFAETRFVVPAFVAGISATGTIIGAQIDAATVGPTQTYSRNRVKTTRTSNQSITSGSPTTVNFNGSDLWDVGSLHDLATNNDRLVIPTGGDTGVWLVTATVTWAANATGSREVRIWHMPVGGGVGSVSAEVVTVGAAGFETIITVSAIAQPPAVGDFFTCEVTQTSGGPLDVTSARFAATHLW